MGIGCTKPENTSCDYYPNRFGEPPLSSSDRHYKAHHAAVEKMQLMLTPEAIRRTECLGDTRCLSCSDIDRKGEAEELYEVVREAVDPSVSVRWHEEDWSVSVDWRVVGSVEEALEVTTTKKES